MQKYQSHKVVEAAKIKAIRFLTEGRIQFVVDGDIAQPTGSHSVTDLVITKEKAEMVGKPVGVDVGWYYIRYPDGYFSFSPAEQFEEGYSKV